MKIYPYRQP